MYKKLSTLSEILDAVETNQPIYVKIKDNYRLIDVYTNEPFSTLHKIFYIKITELNPTNVTSSKEK